MSSTPFKPLTVPPRAIKPPEVGFLLAIRNIFDAEDFPKPFSKVFLGLRRELGVLSAENPNVEIAGRRFQLDTRNSLCFTQRSAISLFV